MLIKENVAVNKVTVSKINVKVMNFDSPRSNKDATTEGFADRIQHPHFFQSTLHFSPLNQMKFSSKKQPLTMSQHVEKNGIKSLSREGIFDLSISRTPNSRSIIAQECKKARMPTQKI